jgi:signal transduction histidine kinase
MLYETLTSGRRLAPIELQLPVNRRWFEVSTHPVHGDAGQPVGAVLVFRDLTEQKAQALVRQRAEQREVLTRVLARIADEIKNPLVSISTFVELLDERYEDPDFRRDFSAVVRRDAGRLVHVLDKLRGLVEGAELNCIIVDVRRLMEEFIRTLSSGAESSDRPVTVEFVPDAVPHLVKVDTGQLQRAVGHLVAYLAHASPEDPARVTISAGRGAEPGGPDAIRVLITSRTARVPADRLLQVLDPVQMMQEGLVAVGPSVSQRIVESLGGQLRLREGRHELGFLLTLPPAE